MPSWNEIEPFAQLSVALATLVTLALLAFQVRREQKAVQADAFLRSWELLQAKSRIEARAVIYDLEKSGRSFGAWDKRSKTWGEWTDGEKQAAEEVGRSFEAVCIMVRQGFLSNRLFFATWSGPLERSWKAIAPLVEYRRNREDVPQDRNLWSNMEWCFEQIGTWRT